jgi:hypothetical protein
MGIGFMSLVMPVFAGNSPISADVEGALGTNDNVGQAEHKRNIVNDHFAKFNTGAEYTKELDPAHLVTFRGFLETEQWQEVRGLSRYTAGGKASFEGQYGVGPTAPRYELNATLQADEYDHSQRDSTVFTSQLIGTKPFTEKISSSLGIEYRNRDSSGSVWDLDQVRTFLNGVYTFLPGWSAYGIYSYIDGDVWSTAQSQYCNGTPATNIYGLVSVSKAIEPDKAFNEAFCGKWLAYRLSAHTNTLQLGINKDLGHDMTADFSFQGIKVNAKGDNEYDSRIFQASLIKRF